MLVVADGQQRAGWALRHVDTGVIGLESIVEDETSAYALLRAMKARQPRRGKHDVVPITLTVTVLGE